MSEERFKIQSAIDMRGVLGETMLALLKRNINVATANAVVGLASEFHKSIRQEFDERCYTDKTITIDASDIKRIEEDE